MDDTGLEALRRIKATSAETCAIITKPFSFQYLDSVLEVHMLTDHIDPKSA